MTCQEIEKILPGYLDQGLSAEEERLVAEHLKTCPACRETLSELTRSVNLAKGLEDVEPPVWLKAKIMEQVRAEAKAGRHPNLLSKLFFPLHIKIPLEALATLVVAIFAFYLYRATAPELITPGAPRATVQESAPTPMAETAPAGQAALPEPQRQPLPIAKAPVTARKSTSLNHLRPASKQSEEEQAPPALQDIAQAQKRTEAPAPAAAISAESKAKDAYPSKEEDTSADKLSKAQAPLLGLSARKAAPLNAETAAVPPAITLAVADIRQTIAALEKIVRDLHGRSTVLEQTDTVAMLRVILKPDQMQTLMTKVAGLGEFNLSQPTPEAGTDTVILRLVLLNS